MKVPLTKTYNLYNSFFMQEDCLTTPGSQIKPWFYCCYELGKLGKDYEDNITGGISVPGYLRCHVVDKSLKNQCRKN